MLSGKEHVSEIYVFLKGKVRQPATAQFREGRRNVNGTGHVINPLASIWRAT